MDAFKKLAVAKKWFEGDEELQEKFAGERTLMATALCRHIVQGILKVVKAQ